jgi:transposase
VWFDLGVAALEDLSYEDLLVLAQAQAARIVELEQANQLMAVKLARLERLVTRNSGNSGMPPSKDDDPGRKPPRERPGPGDGGGDRRRGKRKGAPGASLAWSRCPDETVPHRPAGVCPCGRDLSEASDLGVYASHQQVDVPLVKARVVQHDRHAARCACGRRHVAAWPEDVADTTVSYGPNLVAWCVYLMVVHALPVARCADLVEALCGTRPSDGFVHSLIGRAAEAVTETNKIIRTLVTLAYVVACDETPIRVGPARVKKYLLVACTRLYTWYMLGDRDLDTFKEFVLPDLTGVIVHDRYQNYDSKAFPHLVHQLCCQHLIRDLTDAAETYPGAVWPTQIRDALRALIHQANLARDAGLDRVPAEIADPLISLYRNGYLVGLADVPRAAGRAQPKHRALLEALRDRRADILRFVTDLRIPPTSNQAERDLRPAKTQQKISGRLTSDKITADRYAIRGYVSTVAKHGADIMTAIRDALCGRPWTPPAWTPG